MATAPVKSCHRPLHNFSLPFLKWGQKNHQMNASHRYRTSRLSRDSTPPPPMMTNRRRSSSPGPDSDSEPENLKVSASYRSNRFPFSSCSSQKQQPVVFERESDLRDVEIEESMAKPWNLRPRKAIARAKVAAEVEAASFSKNGEFCGGATTAVSGSTAVQQSENLPKSMRLRGFAEGQGYERKENNKKNKFWISLSREEIEEDVYALTGSRPARRPKKRPRIVQKQVDNVFPGLYLVGITADSYRVHESLVDMNMIPPDDAKILVKILMGSKSIGGWKARMLH